MSPDAVPKKTSGFIVEEMEGETLLYRLGAHKAIHLNETASLIWKLCDGTRSVSTITGEICSVFTGSEARVADDIQEALALLLKEGAVVASVPRQPAAS